MNVSRLPSDDSRSKCISMPIPGEKASFSRGSAFGASGVNKRKSFRLEIGLYSDFFLFSYPEVHTAAMSPENMFVGLEKFLGLAGKKKKKKAPV